MERGRGEIRPSLSQPPPPPPSPLTPSSRPCSNPPKMGIFSKRFSGGQKVNVSDREGLYTRCFLLSSGKYQIFYWSYRRLHGGKGCLPPHPAHYLIFQNCYKLSACMGILGMVTCYLCVCVLMFVFFRMVTSVFVFVSEWLQVCLCLFQNGYKCVCVCFRMVTSVFVSQNGYKCVLACFRMVTSVFMLVSKWLQVCSCLFQNGFK